MTRTVFCVKLQQEAEGLDRPPYPGELGQRIYEQVSKQAWSMWIQQQTMLINEFQLTPADPQARAFIEREMESFFFGRGSTRPPDFIPEQR